MYLIATARFSSGFEGNVVPRQLLNVSDERGNYLISIGVAEKVETKPAPLAYETKLVDPPSVSHPVPLSQLRMSSDAEDTSSSSSTTAGDSRPGQMSSTPATNAGGVTISEQSGKASGENVGPRKRGRPRKIRSTESSDSQSQE